MSGRHIALMAGVALGIAPFATASLITLSDYSSDETDASVLDATFEFEVVGFTLTLTVTNDTLAPSEFKMNALYFNAPDDVTLSFDGAPGWSFSTDAGTAAFGTFDFCIEDGQGGSQSQIVPGETDSFTFTILSGAPTDEDFVTYFSTIPPGDTEAIVAAKFVGGPGDDSAFGASVPTPGVLALMSIAGLVAGRPRRRRE